MANVLTTGASFFAPTKKPSFLSRLFRVQLESRQRQADRMVEQYLATHGRTLTDDAERAIGHLLANGGAPAMITLILAQFATTLARFGKEALATWHEAQQLRRQMPGSSEE